jgi:hypothetical protein
LEKGKGRGEEWGGGRESEKSLAMEPEFEVKKTK